MIRMDWHFVDFEPVADEIALWIIIPAIEDADARPIQMHRDGWPAARITNPMNASLVGSHCRGAVLVSQGAPPCLAQARRTGLGAIVQPLVALLQQCADDTMVGAPGSMVVDGRRCPRWPHKDLQA